MRDLIRYPITEGEIVECLKGLIDFLPRVDGVGSMRPLLLEEAIIAVKATWSPEHLRAQLDADKRFFLAQDDSCHWYVVPAARREEWEAWCEIPSEDERAWEVPSYARELGGSPSMVTFVDPKW